jgi:hypothetical protein
MSALSNTQPPYSKDTVAQTLANAHRAADPAISAIYRIEAPANQEASPREPIKLLEVNPHTTASGIIPVGLGPHAPSGVHFSSIIIEIHPSEWDELQNGNLQLPHGWRVAGRL